MSVHNAYFLGTGRGFNSEMHEVINNKFLPRSWQSDTMLSYDIPQRSVTSIVGNDNVYSNIWPYI